MAPARIGGVRSVRLGLVLLLATLWGFGAAQAADLDRALDAYGKGDFHAVLNEIRPLAERNNAKAQRMLAEMYEQGQGVIANDSLAWSWFRRAANLGDAEAQFRLGQYHEQGKGVPISNAEAIKWYQRAAKLGHATAKARLGAMFLKARGTKPSQARGLALVQEAAQAGEPEAEALLDELGRKGVAIAPLAPAQAAAPPDPEARRFLALVRSWIDPLTRAPFGGNRLVLAGGSPSVAAQSEGGWVVQYPRLEYHGAAGDRLIIGTVRIKGVRTGPALLAVRLGLPTRLRSLDAKGKENGTFTLGSQAIDGVWSEELETFLRLDGLLSDLVIESKRPAGRTTIAQVGVRMAMVQAAGERYDITQNFDVRGLASQVGGKPDLALARLSVSSTAKRVDLAATKAFGKSADGAEAPPTAADRIPTLVGAVAFQADLEGLRGGGNPGSFRGGLDRFEFRFAGEDLDQPLSGASLRVAWQGMAAEDLQGLPVDLALALAAERLPLRDLVNQMLASLIDMATIGTDRALPPGERPTMEDAAQDLLATSIDAFADAQSVLRLDEFMARGPDFQIEAKGRFKAEMAGKAGFSGALEIAGAGLDQVGVGTAPGLMSLWSESVRQSLPPAIKDSQGRDLYRLEFRPEGGLSVNGVDWQPGTAAKRDKKEKKDKGPVRLAPTPKGKPQPSKP